MTRECEATKTVQVVNTLQPADCFVTGNHRKHLALLDRNVLHRWSKTPLQVRREQDRINTASLLNRGRQA